jgi:hypothetical protein
LTHKIRISFLLPIISEIGFDGIWQQYDTWNLVVEVKTTDAYRIPLDAIAKYRNRLIESGKIIEAKSSILIIVGRDDTGELEAQIRGSKQAWDIRIISIDSLIRLLISSRRKNKERKSRSSQLP